MNSTSSRWQQECVRFPPRWRNVLLPASPPYAAAQGMSLYTASKPLPLAAQELLWAAARASRGRVLPGPRETWSPPMPDEEFDALAQDWARSLGRLPSPFAIHQRLQAARASLTLLLCGRDGALIRVREDGSTLDLEHAVSDAAAASTRTHFRVPRVLARGEAGRWSWIAYEPIAHRPHRPVTSISRGMTDEISELVRGILPRPSGTPEGWRASHGDLTPWNLRRGGLGTWLIDWEDAAWAPPRSDEVYFAAVRAAMARGPATQLSLPADAQEAAARWAAIVRDRPIAESESRLRSRLLAVLGDSVGQVD